MVIVNNEASGVRQTEVLTRNESSLESNTRQVRYDRRSTKKQSEPSFNGLALLPWRPRKAMFSRFQPGNKTDVSNISIGSSTQITVVGI